jgi:hypothetical protein
MFPIGETPDPRLGNSSLNMGSFFLDRITMLSFPLATKLF